MGPYNGRGLKINEISFGSSVRKYIASIIYTYNNEDERPSKQINCPYFRTFRTIIYHYLGHLIKKKFNQNNYPLSSCE